MEADADGQVDDDGNSGIPKMYLVRYSSSGILAEADWNAAMPITNDIPLPGIAGVSKSMLVSDLKPGGIYYFAIRAQDEEGNLGALSNSPVVVATLESPMGAVSDNGGGDTSPPAAINDLAAVPSAEIGSVGLTWTTPGDDGNSGIASSYLVRYNPSEILSEADWNMATPVESGIPSPERRHT